MEVENNTLVSIIVPVYNMGDKIEGCVKSLINQTYENYEIILVDDGSKDDSLERCKRIANNNPIVKVYHTENRGSGPARNFGIEKSKGKYLYFPDADDFIDPDAIKILVTSAINADADLVLCGYRDVDEKGKVIYEKRYKYAEVSGEDIRNNYAYYKVKAPQFGLRGAPWNKLFRRDIVIKNNIQYPPLRRHQDEAFIARYFCYCVKAVFIEDILYTYYTNDQSAEWKKYPVDYIDAVKGLYIDRKCNVLTWNPKDLDTQKMVTNEFICNSIKSLELSFSPKFSFSTSQRMRWIRDNVMNSEIINVDTPNTLGVYQRTMMKLIKKHKFFVLYIALMTKVLIAGKILRKR